MVIRRAACSLLALLAACSRNAALPPLPTVPLEPFQPAIRAEVEKALSGVRAKPGDAEANGRLGMVLHAHDQLPPARICYQRAAALDPKSFAWSYYLASVEKSLGNLDAALTAVRSARALRPEYAPARLLEGDILIEQAKFSDAASAYAAVLAADPGSAAAWYAQGRAQAALDRTADAQASFQKAVELFPRFGQAHFALAQSLRKTGRAPEAAKHTALYERHRTAFPNTNDEALAEVLRLNVSAAELIRQGAFLDSQGRLADAIALHVKAIESDPKSPQAHANLVSLYARSGDAARAEQAYKAAIALDPNFADAHYNYGVIAFRQGDASRARSLFQRALATNPQHADAHANLGFILDAHGASEAAIGHYRKAIENQPNHRLAHFHLGRTLTNRRNYAEAIAHFEKTLEPEDENTPGYLYALGIAHGRAGRAAQAAEILMKAKTAAIARGQQQLVQSIDKDLRLLGQRP